MVSAAAPGPTAGTVVVKIGTSSVTTPTGRVDTDAIDKLAAEVAEARRSGRWVVVVSSGAIAAGMERPGAGPAPSLRPGHPAGGGRGGPAPVDAGVERRRSIATD